MKPTILKAIGVAAVGVISIFTFFITKNYVFDPSVNMARVPEVTKPKREPVRGCMDKFACNFNPKANTKDTCWYAQYVSGASAYEYTPKNPDNKIPKNKPIVPLEPDNCSVIGCVNGTIPVSIRSWNDNYHNIGKSGLLSFLGFYFPEDVEDIIGQSACDSKKLLDERDKALEELKRLKEAKPAAPPKKP